MVSQRYSDRVPWLLEALTSGFYVVVTRSLVPIFLVAIGFDLKDLLKLCLLSNIVALILAQILYSYKEWFLKYNVKKMLLLFHVMERVIWCSIPLAAFNRLMMTAVYALAITSTLPTTVLITLFLFSLFEEKELRKIYAYRNMLGSISSVVGQVTIIIVLYTMKHASKYLYLYMLAFAFGILSSLALLFVRPPTTLKIQKSKVEEVEVRTVSTFVFFSLFLAASFIMMFVWPPYVMTVLKAEDYVAATLGFAQTISTIIASLVWSKVRYAWYRAALIMASITPIIILTTTNVYLHIGLAAFFAFMYTGGNFLASFIFANLANYDVVKASFLLSAAGFLGQVMGSTLILSILTLGPQYVFLAVTMLMLASTIVAFTMLPEVALVKEQYLWLYARLLYQASTSGYSFTIFIARSYALITLKLMGLTFVLLILYTIYRLVYHVVMFIRG